MAKLNKPSGKVSTASTAGRSPLKVTDKKVTNFEGGDASLYGKKSRLFMMAVNTFSGEDTYYTKASGRDAEMKELALTIGGKDPEWMKRFLPWLRQTANIRTSAITMAVDVANSWVKVGIPGGRQLIASVLQRADEPGEALAYHMSTYGRSIPKPIKRGIADAATRLYSEFTFLKYDSSTAAVRFGDVLELTHPRADAFLGQDALFKYAIDDRHGRAVGDIERLPMIAHNKLARVSWNIKGGTPVIPTTEQIKAIGASWEDVLSALGSKVPKKDLWEALIPSMGFMALLRNLRNFEQAGISKSSIKAVQARLADPAEVAKSKQLPMRFLSAYRNVVGDNFKYAIGEALQASLNNIPALPGRTLILVDTSGSMNSMMSGKSELKRWDAAVMFGLALADQCEQADVVSFSDAQRGYSPWSGRYTSGEASKVFPAIKGESLLRGIERWNRDGFFIEAGTDTAGAVSRHFDGHDRIIILTDEESRTGNPYAGIPDKVVKIDINLAGYGHSHAGKDVKNLIKLAGLTDSMFTMIPWLEGGLDQSWPF